MIRLGLVALVLSLLLPLTAEASRIPPRKAKIRRHAKAISRTIPPDPNTPDPFFKTIDSKAFLVVDGLDYPVPRNINRKPDAGSVNATAGQEVFTAVDPTQ